MFDRFGTGKATWLATMWLALAAIVMSDAAPAQTWPTRPVTMVVTYAAGGTNDVIARILAARLSDILGQQVVVENVGGAGGMTGAARVAKAAPDGTQFVLGNVGTHAQNQTLYRAPLYNAATDFAPVGLLVDLPMVMVTRMSLPPNDLPEFIAYAKANQAKMQYGSAGTGAPTHLSCALLNAVAAIPHIEGKTAKAITMLSRKRSPAFPNLTTAHEQGLTDFAADNWLAFFMPKGTPAAIVQRLNEASVATLTTPAVEARLKELGADVVAPDRRSPEFLQNFVASEIEKWAGPIKAAGVSAE